MRDHENIDLYAVLQVHPTAEPEIVDAAYRRLARMYHPDVNKSPGAHQTMVRINLAYEILGDPAKRAAYDIDRANRQQTEWQAWTERAEREQRERAERAEQERRAQAERERREQAERERAEREQRQRQAQTEREQRERNEQAERERQARANAERQRAEQEQAEREQRERQTQAEPTHQSYAEWEAEMQRQVRANAERQRAESERQARTKQEASVQSQQGERADTEHKLPFGKAIVYGMLLGSIYCIIAMVVFVPLYMTGQGVVGISIVGIIDFFIALCSLLTVIVGPFGGLSARDPHPQRRIRFVRAFLATLFVLLSFLGIWMVASLLSETPPPDPYPFIGFSSFIFAAVFGIVFNLFFSKSK